ncbi:GNAT family N-acetyltransferase [Mammaliicoccus sciuri]|uniref:GNAT family N-acetyltransferase n=1 Tax=Mammaliicoccus sciuri TaxID=1296 RepID=UPI003F57FB9D
MLIVQKADNSILNDIYLMGYDTWANNLGKENYLENCRNSTKYKKGVWYVGYDKDCLVTFLIIYHLDKNTYGIGSVATNPLYRKKGYAHQLIRNILKNNPNKVFFLYSDINPNFYRKLGFVEVERKEEKNINSRLMMFPESTDINTIQIPSYF